MPLTASAPSLSLGRWRRRPGPRIASGAGCARGARLDLACGSGEMQGTWARDDQRSWDRYQAAQWLSMRRWLDSNPADELADEVRGLLATEPAQYARYVRELLGWGVFVLMAR